MKRELFKYKIPTYPYFYSQNMTAPLYLYKDKPIVGEWFLHFSKREISEATVEADTFLNTGKNYLKYLQNNDKDFVNYLDQLFEKMIKLADKLEKVSYLDHKNNQATDLKDFYKEYCDIFVPAFAIGYCLDFATDLYLKENNTETSNISSMGSSFILKEKLELKDIFKQSEILQDNLLKEHTYKYNWILNNYTGEHLIGLEYFKNRKKELESFVSPKINPVKKPTDLLEWISYLTYIRDERKRLNLITIGLMDRYLKNVCQKNNLVYEYALMLLPDELENFIVKSAEIPKYEDRFMVSSFTGPKDTTKAEFESFSQEDIDFDGTLTGAVASRGKVKGKVKIVLSREDFHKVDQGDIIVASMTRPEFAPILNKCSAIVTNEGGVTCHAAIVSRELGIPCIIGTKVATQVFKDSDIIEVDANRGFIKKLN